VPLDVAGTLAVGCGSAQTGDDEIGRLIAFREPRDAPGLYRAERPVTR